MRKALFIGGISLFISLVMATVTGGAAVVWNEIQDNAENIRQLSRIQLETVRTLATITANDKNQERRLRELESEIRRTGLPGLDKN